MGKNNKKRKRTNHALFHAVKARMTMTDGSGGGGGIHKPRGVVENNNEEEEALVTTTLPPKIATTNGIDDNDEEVTDEALAQAVATLEKVVASTRNTDNNNNLFHSKRCKALRRVLHPLMMAQLEAYDKGIDYRHRVTLALKSQNWSDALAALQACHDFQQVPKQGTVQRWVRDCTLAGNCAGQLLQAILKASGNTGVGDGNKHDPSVALAQHLASNVEAKEELTILEGWKWWEGSTVCRSESNSAGEDIENEANEVSGDNQQKNTDDTEENDKNTSSKEKPEKQESNDTDNDNNNKEESAASTTTLPDIKSKIVYREAAADRTPPNHYNLILHTLPHEETILQWSENPPTPTVHAVPFLPAPARIIGNVFSETECQQLRHIMNQLGYRPDHPVSLEKPTGIDSCEWMLQDCVANTVLERVSKHLPPSLQVGGKHNKLVQLHSINRRWRCFRYSQESVYRPHLDGSWPLCYLKPEDGKYHCPTKSNIKSYLTFLIYLNDDFEGGETRFYLPQGVARGVVPKAGSVLVFPQGNLASLIHEGSNVTKGTKYVVRTDVLYRPLIDDDDYDDDEGDDDQDGNVEGDMGDAAWD